MTYDPRGPAPRSVEIQRQAESVVARVMAQLTLKRVLLLMGLAFVVDVVTSGEPTNGSSSGAGDATAAAVAAWIEAITLTDVATWGAYGLAGYLLVILIIGLHELCHLAAFRYFGVESAWCYRWPELWGRRILLIPPSGLCSARHEMAVARLSWWEDAVVSLAPLALTATVSIPVVAYHLAVEPLPLFWYLLAVLIMTGPSPPDYLCLLNSPRERWDRLVERVDAQEPHRAAEGYHV